jgi:trans-aconitate methyltransferase
LRIDNINTFNQWAIKGKDKDMEIGHAPAVNEMFNIISSNSSLLSSSFDVVDIGCGNGWVIRKFLNNNNCNHALGIDGAPEMINIACKKDSLGEYINVDIDKWDSDQNFDIIFSMETFYYLKDLNKIISNFYNSLNKDGIMIVGIDHYLENKPSLSWDKNFNLSLNTLSIDDWIDTFKNNGFKNIQASIYGTKENWNGTLILFAIKN